MNREMQRAQKRIEESIARVDKIFGLTLWWDIHHNFIDGHEDDDQLDKDGNVTVYLTLATTTAVWKYRIARFRWYLPAVARADDDELDWYVTHEFVHVLCSPVATYLKGKDAAADEEGMTESIARVIRRAQGLPGPV